MRVLCLADTKTPAMGLLEFIVNQTDRMLPKYLDEASKVAKNFLSGPMAEVLSSDSYTYSDDTDEEDEDEDDKNDSDIEPDVEPDVEPDDDDSTSM